MANKRNYQKELERVIEGLDGKVPVLLLHSCCAPCSSYVLEYLSEYFQITVFYYNPNIYPPEEYEKRVQEQQDLIRRMEVRHPVDFQEGAYDTGRFMRWPVGWKNFRKDRRDVSGAMNCACGKPLKQQNR